MFNSTRDFSLSKSIIDRSAATLTTWTVILLSDDLTVFSNIDHLKGISTRYLRGLKLSGGETIESSEIEIEMSWFLGKIP